MKGCYRQDDGNDRDNDYPEQKPDAESGMSEQPGRIRERLIVLVLLGAIAFNFPILALFAREGQIAGIPLLVIYLFLAWAVFIFATWWIVGRRPRERTTRGQR